MSRTLSPEGLDFLKRQEGLRLTAYRCAADVWTIGHGHAGPDVKPGMRVTLAEAEELLRRDVARFERVVEHRLDAGKVPVTGPQFDALVSLAFNIGTAAFAESSVARRLDEGDVPGAAEAFLFWDKVRDADGNLVVSRGLQARRGRERELFLSPAAASVEDPPFLNRSKETHVALAAVKPWYASRTVWGGIVAAVCGLLPLLGLDVDAGTQGAIADVAVQSVGVAGAVAAIVFRVKADKKLIGTRPESGRVPERKRVGR